MRLTQSIRWLHLYLPIVLHVNSSLCYAGLAWAHLSRVHSMHKDGCETFRSRHYPLCSSCLLTQAVRSLQSRM